MKVSHSQVELSAVPVAEEARTRLSHAPRGRVRAPHVRTVRAPRPSGGVASAGASHPVQTMIEKEAVHVGGTIVARTVSTGIIQAMKGMFTPKKPVVPPPPTP